MLQKRTQAKLVDNVRLEKIWGGSKRDASRTTCPDSPVDRCVPWSNDHIILETTIESRRERPTICSRSVHILRRPIRDDSSQD